MNSSVPSGRKNEEETSSTGSVRPLRGLHSTRRYDPSLLRSWIRAHTSSRTSRYRPSVLGRTIEMPLNFLRPGFGGLLGVKLAVEQRAAVSAHV